MWTITQPRQTYAEKKNHGLADEAPHRHVVVHCQHVETFHKVFNVDVERVDLHRQFRDSSAGKQ